VTQDQKVNGAAAFFEAKMVRERFDRSPPQSFCGKMKLPRIANNIFDGVLQLLKESVSERHPSRAVVVSEGRSEIILNEAMETHRPCLSCKVPLDLFPGTARIWISLQLGGAAAGLGNALVVIRKHRRQRVEQLRREKRSITFRQFERALLDLIEFHLRNLLLEKWVSQIKLIAVARRHGGS
jgi:hypothetical protein